MADLLGSILGKMQSPPGLGEEEKKKAKEQKRRIEKIHQLEKEKLSKFREKMQKEIGEFVKDSTKEKHKFLPMEKTYRAVLHEVAEIAGLVTFSFGDEDIDRYVMVWKKEFAPSDDELTACRKGEEWDPEKAKQLSRLKAEENQETSTATSATVTPQSNYKDKYERIIGKDSAKDAAKLTLTNRSYGFGKSKAPGKYHIKILVPASLAPDLGPYGYANKQIKKDSGGNIDITRKAYMETGLHVCRVRGKKMATKSACMQLLSWLDEQNGLDGKVKILVPKPAVELITGTAGRTLVFLTNRSHGAQFNMEENTDPLVPECVVTISGNSEQVQRGLSTVYDQIIDEAPSQACPDMDYDSLAGGEEVEMEEESQPVKKSIEKGPQLFFKILLQSHVATRVIGRGGENVKRISRDNHVLVSITHEGYVDLTDRICVIKGKRQGLRQGLQAVIEQRDQVVGQADAAVRELRVLLPKYLAEHVCGLDSLAEDSGASISIDKEIADSEDIKEYAVIVKGDKSHVEKAVNLIYEEVIDDPMSQSLLDVDYDAIRQNPRKPDVEGPPRFPRERKTSYGDDNEMGGGPFRGRGPGRMMPPGAMGPMGGSMGGPRGGGMGGPRGRPMGGPMGGGFRDDLLELMGGFEGPLGGMLGGLGPFGGAGPMGGPPGNQFGDRKRPRTMSGNFGGPHMEKRLRVGEMFIKVLVPEKLVGVIIGKGGEAIQRLCNPTSASMDFSKESYIGTNERVCMVTAQEQDLFDCVLNLISRIEEINGTEQGDVIQAQFLLPTRTIGKVIGSGGSNIKQIKQEVNQVEIDIDKTQNTPERTVTLSGAKEDVIECFKKVYNIALDDPTSQSHPSVDYGMGMIPMGVEVDMFGQVMPGGRSLFAGQENRARAKLKATNFFSQQGIRDIVMAMSTLADYGFVGPAQQLNPAVTIHSLTDVYGGTAGSKGAEGGKGVGGSVWAALDKDSEEEADEDMINMGVADNLVGLIIGPQGAFRIELEELTGVTINISKKGEYFEGTNERIVTIDGPKENCLLTKKLIEKRIEKDQKKKRTQTKKKTKMQQMTYAKHQNFGGDDKMEVEEDPYYDPEPLGCFDESGGARFFPADQTDNGQQLNAGAQFGHVSEQHM